MKNLKTFIVICAMMMSTPAFAEDKNWYVGLSGGLMELKDWESSCKNENDQRVSCKDGSGGIFQATIGKHFNDHISADLTAGLGSTEVATVDGEDFDANLLNLALGVTGYWPLGEKFSIYGKGGFHYWEMEVTNGDFLGLVDSIYTVRESEDGFDPYLGAGAEFLLSENFGLRAELVRYYLDDDDMDTITFGLVAYF